MILYKLQKSAKRNQGFSLLELLLVAVIITTIIITSTRYFSVVSSNAQLNSALQEIKAIREATNAWIETNPDYTNISLTKLNDMGLIPKNIGNGEQASPWGTDITVQANPSNPQQVQIIFNAPFPAEACASLYQMLIKQATNIVPIPSDCGDVAKELNHRNFIIIF